MNFEHIDFVKHKKIYFTVPIIIIAAGLLIMAFAGLNLGVDFKAGTSLDITVSSGTLSNEKALELIEAGNPELNAPIITIGGEGNRRVSARFDEVLTEEARNNIIAQFQQAFGADAIDYEESTVDVEIAKEFALKAVVVLLLATLGISIYISFRFEWRYALAAIVALIHDALIVLCAFAFFRFEFSLTIIAAILTIIGYSINDKIVLFDRMRENMQKAKLKNSEDLSELVNVSIRQTMTRTINTGVTILIPAFLLMILGSESIRYFSAAMVIGLIAAPYSSVFLAAQLWHVMRDKALQARKRPAANQS